MSVASPNPFAAPAGTTPNPFDATAGGAGTAASSPEPQMFPTTVRFHATDPGAESRGDPLGDVGPVVYDGPASVTRVNTRGDIVETYRTPEGRTRWTVETPTDPGVRTGYLCKWLAKTFRVDAAAGDVSGGAGVQFMTDCTEIS
jgi:hypothetical protein